MEHLIKKVEDFRTHVKVSNLVASLIFIIFGVNSIIEINFNKSFPLNCYLFFVLFLMLFLAYYFFKYRKNLPLPMEITKESLEEYQRQQLKRYLVSSSSMIWWFILPFSQAALGIAVIKALRGSFSYIAAIIMISIFIYVFIQSKIFYKKYLKQYEELGGSPIDLWFNL
ncbi:MAG: hypothetical protein E2O68_08660 [Deltaproteobacteria bacterium]|nr:MAG: hypothetical protein E2O68_08660 [Deltaproteobacteria bacterium]